MLLFLFLQLKEEQSVHGSDEEVDDPLEADSDEDLSDKTDEQALEEVSIIVTSACLICNWHPACHVN